MVLDPASTEGVGRLAPHDYVLRKPLSAAGYSQLHETILK